MDGDFTSADGSVSMTHEGGTPWWSAPIPRRWHRCHPQTSGLIDYFTTIERCACGAFRRDGRVWIDRNSRRGRS